MGITAKKYKLSKDNRIFYISEKHKKSAVFLLQQKRHYPKHADIVFGGFVLYFVHRFVV